MSDHSRPIDPARVAELTARENRQLDQRTLGSKALYERARESLCNGVGSAYQWREPWPIYLTKGRGSRIWDVDGTEYIDYLNGSGAMVQGHGHPAIIKAVTERIADGSHFCEPTEEGVVVAEELARRFGLPKWRFTNSGSEATMDAIRIARAHTGRDTVIKVFGSYHGHHDYVMVSIYIPLDEIGPRDAYKSISYGAGIPQSSVDMTAPVPFNDAAALERRIEALVAEGRPPACLIMEAAMMNLGVILPEPGYLEAVREITRKHGVVLIFDEVKTGLTVAPGGATEHFGVTPDLITLAKALGGGLPSGAVGGTDEVMAVVESGDVYQVGTYNGNPLVMAAARATLMDVLTPEAYRHIGEVCDTIGDGCRSVIDEFDLPAYPVSLGAKGCVTFAASKVVDYESYVSFQDGDMMDLAWTYMANRGVFAAPGRDQEYTISVQHSVDDALVYVDVFRELAAELRS